MLILLVGISTISVSSAFAHPGEAQGTPDPWADPPTTPEPPKTPEPPGDGDTGDTGDNNKKGTVLTQIFKVIFDTDTMTDAIVNALVVIFTDATESLSMSDNPLFIMGSEISNIVFESAKLEKTRRSSWLQLRKVAFALLPLTAALTIWSSMKDGLYSVTGYANTFEAIAEFFVSLAIALASFWLMEQAISLTKTFTLAIAESLEVEVRASVYAGMLVKPASLAMKHPITSMVLGILSFALVLTYMGSVTIAFLAREVVLIMTVALAPVMIILGAVRPLAWLRGLWAKAFLIFLLLLPINVLIMGIAYKLWVEAMDLKNGAVVTILQLLILTGTLSVLIAVNGTLGKMVYGAAIEVAQKVGDAFTQVAAMGATLVGVAATGGLGGAALAGTGGSVAPVAGGGTGLGLTAGSQVTSTSKLTSTIGSVLSSSGNRVVRGFGNGMKVGSAVKDHKLATATPPPGPKLDIANTEVPGIKEGKADVMSQIDTPEKANAIGLDQGTLSGRVDLGVKTGKATLAAGENNDIPGTDLLREAGHLGRGNWDVKTGVREFIRSEAGTFALHEHSMFKQNDIPARTPATKELHGRDILAAQRIAQYDQRYTTNSPYHQVSSGQIEDLAEAVRTQRLSGMNDYRDIVDDANRSASLSGWLRNIQGKS